jgi:hypothetical protein
VPKASRWIEKDKNGNDVSSSSVMLTAITHFCFELVNAKNSKYFSAIHQESISKIIKDGSTYARRIIEIEVDSGLRTGRMIDGAIYFGLITKELANQLDPSKNLLNDLYYKCSNNSICKAGISKDPIAARPSRDILITDTLKTFYVGTNTTRESRYSDQYKQRYP